MGFSKELYEQAQKIIDGRREKAEEQARQRERLFEEKEPEYKALKQLMMTSVLETFKTIDMPPDRLQRVFDRQKRINLDAQERKRALLKKHSLPENYFDTAYTCPICGDTGFNGSKLCECYIELLKSLAYEQAGKRSPLKFCRFEDFKLSYYPDEYSPEYKCSPRERMEKIFTFCRDYAAGFDSDSQSLLMYGETGLGKTHLSLAIAGEAIKKGFNVIYNSAQNIFTSLNREYFGKGCDGYDALVKECGLLVIDDLGAEFSTQFTDAAFGEIINTRINYGLPTIISTNLCFKELEEKYTRRISSRIIGEFAALCFLGSDIRQLKLAD